ncbi:MAG: hypothetical protein ABI622_01225 [Chloroflexota bacterium]
MRRSIPAALVVGVGLLLLLDFLVVNPTLGAISGAIVELVVILFAAAAVLGAILLAVRHAGALALPGGDRIGSALVLVGMAIVLVPGLMATDGAAAPSVRWVVGALVVPIGASLLALVAVFLIPAARRGMRLRPRDTAVILVAACVVVVLLLPLGGDVGAALGDGATWVLDVPLRAVFAGLLIGVSLAAAVAATRFLFGLAGTDD